MNNSTRLAIVVPLMIIGAAIGISTIFLTISLSNNKPWYTFYLEPTLNQITKDQEPLEATLATPVQQSLKPSPGTQTSFMTATAAGWNAHGAYLLAQQDIVNRSGVIINTSENPKALGLETFTITADVHPDTADHFRRLTTINPDQEERLQEWASQVPENPTTPTNDRLQPIKLNIQYKAGFEFKLSHFAAGAVPIFISLILMITGVKIVESSPTKQPTMPTTTVRSPAPVPRPVPATIQPAQHTQPARTPTVTYRRSRHYDARRPHEKPLRPHPP